MVLRGGPLFASFGVRWLCHRFFAFDRKLNSSFKHRPTNLVNYFTNSDTNTNRTPSASARGNSSFNARSVSA